ncbi:DUF6985 domain-containing protein [Cognatishimia activa]|uniref:DUF6985 domain-containing protein n=1 Tax=Cognatishimia activa TaxID=1715691 RepID=UPI00222FE871|nr:hypothetical protein [Cognatishimia activa]UZD89997.1 hypothetical protein M0D42_10385 [Cognatishimia activa]
MEFKFDDFWWQADVQFSTWSEFTEGKTAKLIFAPEGRDEAPMSADDVALTTWVKENHERQKPIILNAVLEAYPDFRRQFFEDYNIDENEEDLPKITSVSGLTKVIALEEIFVHPISKQGVPYVGYQFACSWDEEHGLGVLMHDKRVIEVGGADTAFVLWIAKRDRNI